MPAQLLALSEGPSILLDKPIMLFGRHPECDIQLNSRKVSRRHCCLAQVNDYFVIRDLGSTNGVRINGTRVTEGKLRSGDELTIGNFRYQVFWEGADGASRNGPPVVRKKPINDDDLEEADEPVELSGELPQGMVPIPARPVDDPPTVDDSFRLPDNLELLPPSDPKMKAPPEAKPNDDSRG